MEWDDAKSRATLEKHGFDFEYAARIFEGTVLEREDRRRNYGERRIVSVGQIQNDVFVVVYTWRENHRRAAPAGESVMTIVRRSAAEIRKHRGRIDRKRVRATTDQEIAAQVASDPDTAPLLDEEWFKTARLVTPQPKVPVSIRVDRDVLEWFKARGPRYQSRMNAVLKAYVAAHSVNGDTGKGPNP